MSKIFMPVIVAASCALGVALDRTLLRGTGSSGDENQVHEKRDPAESPFASKSGSQRPQGGASVSGNAGPFGGTAQELLSQAAAISGTRNRTKFINQCLENLDATKLSQLASELGDIPAWSPGREEALSSVLYMWVKQDASAALAWAKVHGDREPWARRNAFMAVAAENPSQLRQLIASLETAKERSEAAAAASYDMLDIPAALALLKEYPGTQTASATGSVLSRWARTDPAAAFAAISSIDSEEARRSARAQVIASWGQQDPVAALNEARKDSGGSSYNFSVDSVLGAWARKDLAAAKAWFLKLPPGEQKTTDVLSFIQEISEKEPSSLVPILQTMSAPRRSNAITNLVSNWGGRDPDGAAAWIKTLASAKDQSTAWTSLGSTAARGESSKVLAIIPGISNPADRISFLRSALANGGENAGGRAQEILSKLPAEEAALVVRDGSVFYKIAQGDPKLAVQMLGTFNVPETSYAWANVSQLFGKADPEAAWAWVNSLPAETQKEAMRNALRGMAEKDGPAALQKAGQITDETTKKAALDTVISTWSRDDPEAFEAASAQLTGPARKAAVSQILSGKAQSDPAGAATYLLALQQSGLPDDVEASKSSISTVASNWSNTDPKQAAAWASRLADGDLKDRFTESLASNWIRTDSMSASAWIKDLPVGKSKDSAVGRLIDTINTSDPEAAVAWAGQIQDEGRKQSAYSRSIKALIKRDPAAGQRALEAAPLTPQAKQRILEGG